MASKLTRLETFALGASLVVASIFVIIGPAKAGAIPIGAGAYSAVTVGVADSTILAAGGAANYFELWNNSPTATVCLNFGAAATISGTACPAGEVTLPPLFHWQPEMILPQDAIHAIASAASTPMTLGAK